MFIFPFILDVSILSGYELYKELFTRTLESTIMLPVFKRKVAYSLVEGRLIDSNKPQRLLRQPSSQDRDDNRTRFLFEHEGRKRDRCWMYSVHGKLKLVTTKCIKYEFPVHMSCFAAVHHPGLFRSARPEIYIAWWEPNPSKCWRFQKHSKEDMHLDTAYSAIIVPYVLDIVVLFENLQIFIFALFRVLLVSSTYIIEPFYWYWYEDL